MAAVNTLAFQPDISCSHGISANSSSSQLRSRQISGWVDPMSCSLQSLPHRPERRHVEVYKSTVAPLCRQGAIIRCEALHQAMEILSSFMVVFAPTLPGQCRVQRQHLGHASQRKRPGGLTLKAMSLCCWRPCAKKTFNLPTACLFRYNTLPQGSDSVGKASRINSSFPIAGGTALMHKKAAAGFNT